MNKKIKRILSVFLTLSMILSMIPVLSLPAYAEGIEEPNEITVTSWEHLSYVLNGLSSKEKVILGKDIKFEYEYDDYHTMADLIHIWDKRTLDLNGHKIELVDQSVDPRDKTKEELAVFTINPGGVLHIIDSRGGGEVWHHSQLSETNYDVSTVSNRRGHNVFLNQGGDLVVDGGNFIAGRKSKTWCVSVYKGIGFDRGLGHTLIYNGWGYNLSSGSVLRHKKGNSTLNGGSFTSHGDSTIWHYPIRDAGNINIIINGGNYNLIGDSEDNAYVIDSRFTRKNDNFQINRGTFSTERLIVREYQNDEWRVTDVQPKIIDSNQPTLNEDARFKYDGKERDLKWVKDNISKSSKKFEVIAGSPKISLSPEVEDNFYVITIGAKDYKIEAVVEPYLKDIGLGRKSELKFNLYNYNGGSNSSESVLTVKTDKKELTPYNFWVGEYDSNNKLIGGDTILFDTYVVEQSSPKVTVESEERVVNLNENVILRASVDREVKSYKWEVFKSGATSSVVLSEDGSEYSFTANEEGIYTYRCEVEDKYGGIGADIIIITVGGEHTKPSIHTEKVEFGLNTSKTVYLSNSGGIADRWTVDESTLPPGINFSVNADNDLAYFYGKPTKSGTYTVEVTAINNAGKDSKEIQIIVESPVNITTSAEHEVNKGASFSLQLSSNAPAGYLSSAPWKIDGGSLPEGLTLNGETGLISGNIKANSGKYNFTVSLISKNNTVTSKDFTITVNSKPEFTSSIIERTVNKGYKGTVINNLLTDGITDDIEITISGTSDIPSVIEGYGNYHLEWQAPNSEGTYTYTVTATNSYGASTATIKLTTVNTPTLVSGKTLDIVELPWGEVGKPYSSGDFLKDLVDVSAVDAEEYEWVVEYNSSYSLKLEDCGLSLDKKTGVITGTAISGTYEGDELKGLLATFNLENKENSSLKSGPIIATLYIVKENELNAPTEMSLSRDTIGKNLVNYVDINVDGYPTPKITLVSGSLPNKTDIKSESTSRFLKIQTPTTGKYTFKLKAENGLGTIEKTFTINVVEPERAAPPTIDLDPGVYPAGEEIVVTLSAENDTFYDFLMYSKNGSKYEPSEYNYKTINITEDTTISAYVNTAGTDKLDSEIVTFTYTFADKKVNALRIDTTELSNGKVEENYTGKLKATASEDKPISWLASGLPAGLSVASDGNFLGIPSEPGNFTVKVIASTSDTSVSKELKLLVENNLPSSKAPTINIHPVGAIYKMDVSAVALTVEAEGDDTLGYQWYESKDNSSSTLSDDVLVQSGTNKNYTPSTDIAGIKYYYVLVTNSKEGHQAGKMASNAAKIEVQYDAGTPYFDDKDDRQYLFTQATDQIIMEMALVDDGGVLSYEWYKMLETEPDTSKDTKLTLTSEDKDGVLNIKAPATGDVHKYYAVVKNHNEDATALKTSPEVISPIHIVEATDQIMYKITFDQQYDGIKTNIYTNFDGVLGLLPQPERDGYNFKGWYKEVSGLTKVNGDEVYIEDTTLYAQWSKNSSGGGGGTVEANPVAPVIPEDMVLPFIDVAKSDWFYDNVYYVYTNNLMKGTSETTFAPYSNTTRAMIVTILHRLEGTPKAGANPFTDVAEGSYYYDAVAWASENKIVRGYGNGKFGPNDSLTREQLVTILYNYSIFKGYDTTVTKSLDNFADGATVSGYAKTAMEWAVEKGIVTGIGADLLSPTSTATRAQMAAILQRYIETIVE
jgi:uncharacterized repeat protein (TIGR02543 family)